jgi:DNA-binding NtrC family response regulator
MHKIQLVDDDVEILHALQRLLRKTTWQLDIFDKVPAALQALSTNHYAVIIADYRMPKLDGVSYLEWARQKQPAATRILLSAYPESDTMLQAINRAEIFRFVNKPWCNDHLLRVVNQAVARSKVVLPGALAVAPLHHLLVEEEYAELERIEPGITRVEFDEDGAITLSSGLDTDRWL